jgi:hypothetical protein
MHTKVSYNNDEDNSYFSFATTASGYYYILLDELSTQADLELSIYSSDNFTNLIADTSSNETNGEFLYYALDGGKTYYAKVNNYTNSDDIYFDMIVKSPANSTGTGTISAPRSMTIDTIIQDAPIGKSYGDRYNYYKFTTTDTKGFYDMTITDVQGGATLYMYLYNDSKFSDQEGKNEDSDHKLSLYLQANTEYYLQIYNYTGTAINTYDVNSSHKCNI